MYIYIRIEMTDAILSLYNIHTHMNIYIYIYIYICIYIYLHVIYTCYHY